MHKMDDLIINGHFFFIKPSCDVQQNGYCRFLRLYYTENGGSFAIFLNITLNFHKKKTK